MSEPTPRQVLYALVAGGFFVVVAVLVVGAAIAGLSPGWWTALTGSVLLAATLWSVINWRRTGPILILSIGLLIFWTVGTLAVA